jgi:outer membrane receptor protein involved in Fe transport
VSHWNETTFLYYHFVAKRQQWDNLNVHRLQAMLHAPCKSGLYRQGQNCKRGSGEIIMSIYRFMSASALAGTCLVGTAAFAQTQSTATAPQRVATSDASPQTDAEARRVNAEAVDEDATVVVTGSRLNRPNLDSTVPVTSITASELLSVGNISVGDTLSQLPQLRATFSQANSTRLIGTAGISALDLRGLGPARTLVLVDGRRVITATPGINRPDVNNIPNDLLERVDIVTGGSSAVYGSDAVSGVVNFVLKNNLEGITGHVQGGVSSRGDRGSYLASVTAGHNFGDGRGNIAFSAEYAKQNTLFFTDRENQTGAIGGRSQFNAVQNVGANLNPNAGPLHPPESSLGDGIPDTAFLRNIKNNSISEGGLFTAACPTAAATGESPTAFAARRAAACSGLANFASANPLAQFGNTFVFQPDGSLIANPCTTDLRPFGSSNCVGGLGSTLRLTGMLQPGLERKQFNMLGHYEISPAFVPYFSVQAVRADALQEGQPTFFNNTFSIDNPYLTPQARSTLISTLAPGQTTFTAQRFDVDFGGRGELHRRENYQGVVGIRGTFNEDWKYDASFTYGHLYTFYKTAGNLNRAKYANSLNAVRNSAGQIVCGINADATTTNDDPACVPVNLFGAGQPSAAALQYFGYTSSRVQKADLFDGQAFVSGDSSQLFSLPGGPVAFVLGGEIRRETAFAAYDAFTASTACGTVGCTFLNVIPDFRPPAQVTKEAYGELSLPLLRNSRFAYELTVDGAGRVSNYNIGNTGTVVAYNVNAIYAPVKAVRFRVGYARAIRAPTQSDLYAPQSQTFLNGLVDPCGQQNINNNPNRVKNCAAAGVPTTQTFNGTTEPFSNRPASGISGFNGSNSSLNAETSNSFTAGVILQPDFIPGFSMSVDYYSINIKNVIFSLAAQTIINQCYDAPGGTSNPFCAAIFRNPNGTFKGQSDVTHGGTTVSLAPTGPSFISGPFNFAKQTVNGIDVDLSYRHEIANDVKLSLHGIATHTFDKRNYTDITNPGFAQRQLYVLGDPAWQGQLSANVETSLFNIGYRVRYIGKQVVSGAYETQNAFQNRPAQNPDGFPFACYPDITYHDVRIDLNAGKDFKFYMGVDNVLDRLPPYDLLGNEAGDPFSPTGRFFYAGATFKF